MRDRPVRFSDSTGLRLCGMAEEPFWPSEKNSSASSTSVRCKCRISVANRAHVTRTTAPAQRQQERNDRSDAWIDLRTGADRAVDRAVRDLLARGEQPLAGAGKFRIGKGKLQPERDRL